MTLHSPFLFGGFLLVLCTAGSLVLAETGCPPAEAISPCLCVERPSTRLVCSGIRNSMEIEQVFNNAARYTFQEVHIKSSALQYIPSTIFQNVRINELYFEDSTLIALFEEPPTTRYLEKLQLNNTIIQQGYFNNRGVLKQMTGLKTLIVNNCRGVRVVGPTFGENLPSNLTQIILRGSDTKKIVPGAFDSFLNLDKLEISSSKLSALNRDMFPRPFNARFLYFDNNNISSIPSGLFTDMPELQFLSLRNNFITEVPEAAFGNRRKTIPYLRLDGNPLQCNCLLTWLIRNKPEIIGGTCHSPRNLQGRQLEDLLPGDFNCY